MTKLSKYFDVGIYLRMTAGQIIAIILASAVTSQGQFFWLAQLALHTFIILLALLVAYFNRDLE